MKFTQEMVRDLLTGWQNSKSEVRDKLVGDALFPQEYSENNPPRFSQNVLCGEDTEKLLLKLTDFGLTTIVVESLPRSTLCVTRCGDVVIPPMPSHKGIAFIGYCMAKLVMAMNQKPIGM